MTEPTLIISNYDPDSDEVVFHNDVGSWNVSRALRDCRAGKHKVWLLDVEEAANGSAAVEVQESKVVAFAEVLATGGKFKPLLGAIEHGVLWIIDGHHRLRAMHRLGIKEFASYVIEEADAKPYQVFYNGARKPPFKAY